MFYDAPLRCSRHVGFVHIPTFAINIHIDMCMQCMCVCLCRHTYVNTYGYVCVPTCMYVCLHAYKYIHLSLYIYIYRYTFCVCESTHMHTYVRMYLLFVYVFRTCFLARERDIQTGNQTEQSNPTDPIHLTRSPWGFGSRVAHSHRSLVCLTLHHDEKPCMLQGVFLE